MELQGGHLKLEKAVELPADRRTQRLNAQWDWGSWQWNWWQPQGNAKGDYSDPPTWGGWSSYRLFKKALIRWNQNTDVPVWRRFEKLSKQLDWDLQGRFEHVPEQTLASAGYLDVVIGILDGLAGEKDASEKRRVVRAALFEGQRHKEETLSQFAVRREQEFIAWSRQAFILEETAGLSRQGLQNLRTLTGGTVDFDKVVGALKTLDVEEEPLTKGKGGLFSGLAEGSEPGHGAAEPESDAEDDYGERADAFLAQIDDVDEDTALEMLNAFEKEDAKTTERRRTWKQNKDRKAAARKDRRVFSRPRLTVGDLKERTRCAKCGERDHWRAECKKPFRSKEERGRAEGKGRDSGRRAVAFVYLGAEDNDEAGNTFVGLAVGRQLVEGSRRPEHRTAENHTEKALHPGTNGTIRHHAAQDLPKGAIHPKDRDAIRHQTAQDEPEGAIHQKTAGNNEQLNLAAEGNTLCLLALEPGHAILDIGAGHAILDIGAAQDLIGKEAFDRLSERLREQGLRSLKLSASPPTAHGVGGKATPLFQALIPCILAGVPGVVQVTLIKESIPHLLSVGLLESTGAAIDMRRNTVNYQELGVSEQMQRLRSGHRVVDIASWRGGDFPTPPHLKEEFGLTNGAFNLGAPLTGKAEKPARSMTHTSHAHVVLTEKCTMNTGVKQLMQGLMLMTRVCRSPLLEWKKIVSKLLCHRVTSQKPVTEQECGHPADSRVNGANQYGSWQRCLLCQTKISYVPHRARPKKKAGKAQVAYVSEPPPVAMMRAQPASSSGSGERATEVIAALGKVMAENTHQLQVAMAQCNQQVLHGMAQTNQEVMSSMGTMVQTMQAMQVTQQSVVQEVRQVAGGTAAIAQAAGLMMPAAAMASSAESTVEFRADGRDVASHGQTATMSSGEAKNYAVNADKLDEPIHPKNAKTRHQEAQAQLAIKEHHVTNAGKADVPIHPKNAETRHRGPLRLRREIGLQLVRAAGNTFFVGRGRSSLRSVPSTFAGGLGAHLDNLDLEAEPDQDLCTKEKKKIRRAMRNLAGNLEGTGTQEVIEFNHGRRWDFSKGTRREERIGDGRATMWVEHNLEHDFEKEEKEALEYQGAVFCGDHAGDQVVLTNSPGIYLTARPGDAPSNRLAQAVRGLSADNADFAEHDPENDNDEGDQEAGEEEDARGVGDFPLQEDDGEELGQQGHREREVARLIEKLHVNMGHLSRDRMVVMLRAAGAREDVLEFVRKRFGCELCDRRQREVRRRVAAFPRTFTFNRIVAVDTFYLPWRGRSLPVLNVVDHGSHYQVTTLIKTTEGKVVLSDGGAEFAKDFVTGLELHSVFHHVVDADSPWQNGVAERHGGEIKRRVLRELAEGNTVLTSTEGIDLMLCHLTACKNQFYSRAGYSPAQLVFGRNPRVPEELLSDLVASAPGRQAMASDPTNLEGSERAYVQSCIIRQRARELMFEKESQERLQRAAKAPKHSYQQYAPGQWVYVFRRSPQRARWSGPGLVLLHQQTTIWIAMRALGVEIMNSMQYRELLRNLEGKRAGAVDVAKEGTPPEDAWKEPREEEAPITLPPAAEAEPEGDLGTPGGRGHPGATEGEEREAIIMPRNVSIQPRAKERLDPIVEEEPPRAIEQTAARARAADTSPVPPLPAREEGAGRRRSRSPVPPTQRANLERAQAEHLEEMRRTAEDGTSTDEQDLHGLGLDECTLADLVSARSAERERQRLDQKKVTLYTFEEEKEGFKVSDHTEWTNVVGMKVWKGEDARELRRQFAGRILRSRMVRRKKPMPGVGCFKYKSRWCVLGFDDPDAADLRTFSPTPQAEVINVFFQTALNLGLSVVFGDVTSAFCQGRKLARTAGRLFAEPCPGIDAEATDLVELLVAVYGLEDAPVCWAETVQEYLCGELGFRKSLLDPCLYVTQNMEQPIEKWLEAMILVEVDDFNVAAQPEFEQGLLDSLRGKFKFGKWLRNEADFNGRHVRVTENDVYMHQEKYVIEKVKALELSKNRRAQKDSPLNEKEAEEFRSMLYRISWLAHQTRPEAAGLTSILSSRLNRATVSDLITLNKRSTPSDAGGVDGLSDGNGADGMIEDPVQASWLVLASDKVPTHDEHLRVSVLSWRSTKLKRRVTSTLASETLAFSQCLGEIEWMQVLYRDMTFGDVTPEAWRQVIRPFTCLLKSGSSLAGRQEPIIDEMNKGGGVV
ncbi:RE1 [Symbiodinium necroappetens]|uniref:RE1 protein n=1 Tax=Symbiodinium necroappetens TaxID=1628268 RepID=A0A812RHG1_9DINO|nr:RE1 [Symbiodinium necroappetens]